MGNTIKHEVYYRGESKKYEEPCYPSLLRIINQEKDKLLLENRYYRISCDFFQNINFFSNNNLEDEIEYFKYIVALQHYGFGTRLVDITRNKEIAEYFASCNNFKNDGIIYIFDDNEDLKIMKNFDIQSVRRKITCIQHYDVIRDKDINQIFGEEIKKRTIESNVILEYNNVFNSNVENIRYKRQSGAFILIGNKISNENKILDEYNNLKLNKFEIVDFKDKILRLYDMSVKKGINYVYIFPDSDIGFKLKSNFYKFGNKDLDLKIREGILLDLFKSFYNINNKIVLKSKLYEDLEDENKFYFFFVELHDFIMEILESKKNEENIEKIIEKNVNITIYDLIKILIKEYY